MCVYHNKGKQKFTSFPLYEVVTKHTDLEPRYLEAARFRTGIKILGFFSKKRVNLKLQGGGGKGRGGRNRA